MQRVFAKDRKFSKRKVESWWDNHGMNADATQELKDIFGVAKVFTHPKPTQLIKDIVKMSCSKTATILDFFAGSGTTGHAVMNLNAEDGGTRRFILCTNNENGICRDVTYERIRRVIDKEDYAASLKYYKVDYVPISDRMYYEYADELLRHIRELVELPRRENRLRSILAPLIPLYDYVFIDCPPSLDLLTVNGLCACDTVLIPIQCEYYALEGLSELMNTLKIVRKKYNHYLDIEGVVFTMYSGRFNLTMQVVAQVKKYYGNKVYKTVVPRTVRLSEAPSFGMPINFYEPNGKGSEAYMAMAREFLENNERE